MTEYPDVQLLVGGEWREGATRRKGEVLNPATGECIGAFAWAAPSDLDDAVAAAKRGFLTWKATSGFERARILRRAAALLHDRTETIARLLTLEQGKPLAQSRAEIAAGVEAIEWFAGEAQRVYGRIVPARSPGVLQAVIREPIGPVAAFTPWNFPINQLVRKLAAALAAGCSIVAKGPEDTPAAPAALVRAFHDAGLPPGVVNLLYGDPAEISSFLIPHPIIRKVTFTGSTAVGKQLAALAGGHMKPTTMELGGHAPAIVFADAALDRAIDTLVAGKFRNAGQICASPTRFLVERPVYDAFVDRFAKAAGALRVGDGQDPGTDMGPLINARRLDAVDALTQDAIAKGAVLVTGGQRVGNRGYFYKPTVLRDVPINARAMNEEPFGPIALFRPFDTLDDAIEEANRLDYGLAAFAFTTSAERIQSLGERLENGTIGVNHLAVALPEVPFGGVKDSGHGSEGGVESIDAYTTTKLLSVA